MAAKKRADIPTHGLGSVVLEQQARALAEAIHVQMERKGPAAIIRQTVWLDTQQQDNRHMLMLHRYGQTADGIYLGPQLRKRLQLNEKRSLFAPEDLLASICPMELIRITFYLQHFSNPRNESLLQVLKVCPRQAEGEWMVAYSLRTGKASGCILTLFRSLNELLENDLPAHGLQSSAEAMTAALSAREREVLALIVKGVSATRIGDQLNISPLTVKSHRQTIMRKLGVRNLASLVRCAIDMGL